jgi:hypothetical protein
MRPPSPSSREGDAPWRACDGEKRRACDGEKRCSEDRRRSVVGECVSEERRSVGEVLRGEEEECR